MNKLKKLRVKAFTLVEMLVVLLIISVLMLLFVPNLTKQKEAVSDLSLIHILAAEHILNPKDGKPVVTPSQDMVLGNYYLTMEEAGREGEGMVFKDMDEAVMAPVSYTHLFQVVSSLLIQKTLKIALILVVTAFGLGLVSSPLLNKVVFTIVLNKRRY